jgi:hypothetical protein
VADTSLIFNVIARDSGLGRVLDKISNGFRGAGKEAEDALAKASSGTENLDRQIAEAQDRVIKLSQEFERTGDKTLFSKISRDRSLISQLSKIRDEIHRTKDDTEDAGSGVEKLGNIFSRMGGGAASFGSALTSAGSSAAGMLSSISGLIIAALGLVVFQTVAAPAIYAFGGAAAAIPAMLTGAIAAIAVLKLGMSGLSENWAAMNAPAKGGGGGGGKAAPVDMTPKIRAVEAAQRDVKKTAEDVADANARLRQSQLDVAKAYETARERIEDLRREAHAAATDQMEAVQSLTEARQALRLAEGRGNPEEIERARLAVRKQEDALADATDKAEDLGKESAEASKKGVAGSDEVVAARKQEAEASRAVRDAIQAHSLAIQRLGDAQADLKRKTDAAGASGGAMAAVLPKIASNAQEFLNELKRLKPAFDDLRLDIQQRLFEGLAGKLRILAERWLPALHTGLGGMADMMNGVVKTAFDSLSKPKFISDIMVGLQHATGMFGKIGQAIAGPLVEAFGTLTRAAAPVLDVIGDKVAGIITRFAEWIDKMDKNGSLDAFMANAAHILGTVFDMLEDIGRIAGSVISILFGTNLGSTDSWDNLAALLDHIADWLGNPKTQAQISKYLDMFGGLAFSVGNFLSTMDQIPGRFQTAIQWFQQLPSRAGAALSALPGIVSRWASQAANQLGYWIGYGIGWVLKQLWNLPGNTLRAISALPGVFARIGGWLINAVSNLYPWMLSVGKNIVIGIWNGIVSLQSWLWNKAANFAAGIWKGVKDALGIGSPSKVFAKEVGHWIPAGIAMGIDNNAQVVHDAIGAIADDLASTTLPAPSIGMDAAMADATGTLTVSARRQRVEVVSRLDVTGQEGTFKKMVREMARTSNLYQDQKNSGA